MSSCTETLIGGIAAIAAIPVADVSVSLDAQLSPVIHTGSESQLAISSIAGAIGIGRGADIKSLPYIIPTTSKDTSAKDSESDAVPGRSHTVIVTADVDTDNIETPIHLLALERGAYHLLLFLNNGRTLFVSAGYDSYLCTTAAEDNKTTITIRVHNMMGCQRCTEPIAL